MPTIRQLASKKEQTDFSGKGYISTGGSNVPTFFNKMGRDEELIAKWDTIYRQGGLASQCVDAYAYFILSNGWRIEGKSPELVAKVKEICDYNRMNRIFRQYIIDSVIFGRAFIEKAHGKGAKADVPVKLIPLSPKTMRVETDLRGNIVGYTQIIKKDNKEYKVDFKPDEIISDCLFPISGDVYGSSLVGRAFDDIMHDTKISEATATAILRHAFPKYHIKVGQPGEDIDPTILTRLDSEFRKLDAKNEIATNADVEILNIDKDAFPDIEPIVSWVQSRMSISMGIPEVCMGLGRGSTEASSNVEMQTFYDKCSYLQKDVAETFTQNFIDDIVGRAGEVWFIFNDANPMDEVTKADYISKIMMTNQLDPTFILPKKWIQGQFGIDPDMYQDEDHDYGDTEENQAEKDAYYAAINSKREVLPNKNDKMSKANKGENDAKPEADAEED